MTQDILSVQSQIGIERSEIAQTHYHPLTLASPYAYLNFEDISGSKRYLEGKVWSQKLFHSAGMTEFFLAQERTANGFGDWIPLLYRSVDPDVSIASLFDKVPRAAVDPKAGSRLTKIGYGIMTLIIVILLWWIIFDVEINFTVTFFLMLLFAVFSIVILVFYERKSQREDMVDTADILVDAPPLSIARSYQHPLTGEIKRFMGEITPVVVKSSKVSYQKLRGYTISKMSDTISYYSELRELEFEVKEIEIAFINTMRNPDLPEKDKIIAKQNYQEASNKVTRTISQILKKHGEIAVSEELHQHIDEVKKKLQDETFRTKVEAELEQRREELENVYGELAQAQYERDVNEQELRRWMQSANSDLNKSDALVATKFAKLLKHSGLVEGYSSTLPNQSSQQVNGMLTSAGVGMIPFIALLIIGYAVFNSISRALDNMGEWASFMYLIVLWLIAIFAALFTFNYVKSRLVDTMNNTSSSRKVVSR